jgi:cytosine/creatinine deaminase
LDLIIRGGIVEGLEGRQDLGIESGTIVRVAPRLDGDAPLELDADGRIVSPAFVDPHIHLDKVDVAPTLPPNRSGTLAEAIELLHQSKRRSSVDDVAERAGAVIRRAVAAGTTVLRSHVDVDTVGGLVPLKGVLAARAQHADLCRVQIVAFPQEGILRDPGTAALMEEAMVLGADVVGGMPHWESDPESSRRHVEFCMDLAVRHDRDVDMHVDETDDATSRTFEMLIDATERRGWGGRVAASHCCAMAAWEDSYASQMIARAAAVGVRVVTNPATNLMLQGRGDHEPRRRGIPRVKELLAAGVTMGCGQDCVNDAFYPFGVPDQLQVALLLCHAAQLSTPQEIEVALAMVRADAAAVLRLGATGPLRAGAQADVVVLDASDMKEALRFQASRRWVIRSGRVVAETERRTWTAQGNGGDPATRPAPL